MKLKYVVSLLIPILYLVGLTGCTKTSEIPEVKSKRTLLVYIMANNSLSGYDDQNIESMLKAGTAKNLNGGSLIVFQAQKGGTPRLFEIKEGANGVVTQHAIKEYGTLNSADPTVMKQVIEETTRLYPADSYGLILWSHGSAWLPSDYINRLRAFGQDGTHWLEIDQLAQGLPDHQFDFILFDACYMASVECVYELKDKADYILASPTETMGAGWPYELILPYFFTETAQLSKVADLFYNHYNAQSGDYRTATVSLTQTSELSNLAAIVREITGSKDDAAFFPLDRSSMQRLEYLGGSPGLLYDLDDFIKQQATVEQYGRFTDSMKKVIEYEAHTETAYFASPRRSLPIYRSSGLTVYIPREAYPQMNDWYTRLKWYKATRPATY